MRNIGERGHVLEAWTILSAGAPSPFGSSLFSVRCHKFSACVCVCGGFYYSGQLSFFFFCGCGRIAVGEKKEGPLFTGPGSRAHLSLHQLSLEMQSDLSSGYVSLFFFSTPFLSGPPVQMIYMYAARCRFHGVRARACIFLQRKGERKNVVVGSLSPGHCKAYLCRSWKANLPQIFYLFQKKLASVPFPLTNFFRSLDLDILLGVPCSRTSKLGVDKFPQLALSSSRVPKKP